MKLPRAPTSGCGIHRNAPSAGCRWLVGKVSRIDYPVVPKTTGCAARNVNFVCCPGMCRGSWRPGHVGAANF